jgi:hypothetical protein
MAEKVRIISCAIDFFSKPYVVASKINIRVYPYQLPITQTLTFRYRFRTNIWKHVRYVVSFSKFDLLASQY